ncbi:MAG: hypothetical protein KatS3mg092_0854 [Patescibacteria group bacterium]|nr:MAG: hypothetical protein KatS3mg092_0854 [Patescibacteria group bacterium]
MASNFFSIEFDERYIKIIDLKRLGNLYKINYIGKIEILKDFYSSDLEKTIDQQANLLKKFIENLSVNKKNVVVSIPNYYTYHQIFEMPILKEKELISAIKYQADQFIPMPIEETNIDLEIIKEDQINKKLLIMVVAAPKKLIAKVQSTLELSGLIPEAIETQLTSSSRLVSEFLDKKINEDEIVLINFDFYSSTFLSFKNKPLILSKNHNISLGYQLFLKEISINTGFDENKVEELLKNYQLNQSISFPLENIIKPLINELTSEINKFIINDSPEIIYFTNEIVNFPYLINLISQKLPNIVFKILSPETIIEKNQLVNTISFELPLYFSIIGTDLR